MGGTGHSKPLAALSLSSPADLATGNTVTLFRVPKGFTVTGFRVDATDMDTNGTPTITLSVGDGTSGGRFLNAPARSRKQAAR
jgi:hypothetical protein